MVTSETAKFGQATNVEEDVRYNTADNTKQLMVLVCQLALGAFKALIISGSGATIVVVMEL